MISSVLIVGKIWMKNKVVFLVLILCLVFSSNVYAGSIKSAKL